VLGKCRRPPNSLCGCSGPQKGAKPPNFENVILWPDTVDIGRCILVGKMKRMACASAMTRVEEMTRLVAWCGVTSERKLAMIGHNKTCCDWTE
jgi:hypothetical protein